MDSPQQTSSVPSPISSNSRKRSIFLVIIILAALAAIGWVVLNKQSLMNQGPSAEDQKAALIQEVSQSSAAMPQVSEASKTDLIKAVGKASASSTTTISESEKEALLKSVSSPQ